MTDHNNKYALITGATSGIGTVIARHLIQNGYAIIIFGRTQSKINSLIAQLKKVNPNCITHHLLCDLSSFTAVKNACASVKSTFKKIDLLILNAGVWNFKFIETEDKIEETLQVNLLSPILIFNQLKPLLQVNGDSKVILTSSGLHQGFIDYSDIEFRKSFSGFKSYRQSKLGLILIARLFSVKPEYLGISFYTVHPGLVRTKLGRNAGWLPNLFFILFGKSKEKGARTHKYLIDMPSEELLSGAYYANKRVTQTTPESYLISSAEKLLQEINKYIASF